MRLFLTAWIAAGLLHASTMYAVVDQGPFDESAGIAALPGTYGLLPGGTWSAAYGMNAHGEVAGYGNIASGAFRAFTWTPFSGMSMLGTLGGSDSWGMAINDDGVVAGHSTTPTGYIHAFLARAGAFTDLGTLGGLVSYAYGIDNTGSVVGYSSCLDGSLDAYIYAHGVMEDLNRLVPGNSGWTLTGAYSIDDSGHVFGTGLYNDSLHQYRLDPIATPEASTMALLGLGLVLLGCLRRRSPPEEVVHLGA